jgi:RimJ/RimL family protein N-acetyltransferase
MHLHTARLILRNFQEHDLDSFFTYRNDPVVAQYQGWSLPYPLEKAEKFISSMKDNFSPQQGDWVQFAIALKETDELIGDLGCFVRKEDARQSVIGFTIASKYWQKGFAVEAIGGLLEYLFEDMNMHRISADCDTENVASYKTLEKLGFRREAYFVESFLFNNRYTSEYYYGLLRSEWRVKHGD